MVEKIILCSTSDPLCGLAIISTLVSGFTVISESENESVVELVFSSTGVFNVARCPRKKPVKSAPNKRIVKRAITPRSSLETRGDALIRREEVEDSMGSADEACSS